MTKKSEAVRFQLSFPTVYVVESGGCQDGDHSIDGVFSSRGFAQDYIDERKKVDVRWYEPTITDYIMDKGFMPDHLDTAADAAKEI